MSESIPSVRSARRRDRLETSRLELRHLAQSMMRPWQDAQRKDPPVCNRASSADEKNFSGTGNEHVQRQCSFEMRFNVKRSQASTKIQEYCGTTNIIGTMRLYPWTLKLCVSLMKAERASCAQHTFARIRVHQSREVATGRAPEKVPLISMGPRPSVSQKPAQSQSIFFGTAPSSKKKERIGSRIVARQTWTSARKTGTPNDRPGRKTPGERKEPRETTRANVFTHFTARVVLACHFSRVTRENKTC